MAEAHGKSAVLKVDDSGGTLRDLSAYIETDGLARSADPVETTVHGLDSKRYIPGLFDGTIPIEGPFDVTVDGYLAGILNVERDFEYFPAGNTTGMPKYTGLVILNSYELDAPVDGKVSFSGEFQITGDVTRAIV